MTIITFLMGFIIQNTQNRDALAINLKLDELIHAIDTAKNQMMDYPIATGDLNQVTIGESVTGQRAQHEKTVDQALCVAHGHRCRRHRSGLEQRDAGYQNSERGGPDRCCLLANHKQDLLSELWNRLPCFLHHANSMLDAILVC
jgi:Low affinity iron permease